MMCVPTGRLAVWLAPALLLTACGSGIGHATRDLDDRLQMRLAPDIASAQASLQPLPAGAQVVLAEPAAFSTGGTELSQPGRDLLASVIEGLLDPRLLQIEVTDPATIDSAKIDPATTDSVQAARVRNVTQFFVDYGLGASLQPVASPQPTVGSSATGLTITINIQCPPPDHLSGYDSGRARPTCN